MNRAEVLQEVRLMKFEDVYSRRTANKLTQEQAAEILGVSVRTVRRWEDRFEADGAEGLYDRRLGKVASNRVATDKVMEMLELFDTRYWDYTSKHFHEKLAAHHGFTTTHLVRSLRLPVGPALAKTNHVICDLCPLRLLPPVPYRVGGQIPIQSSLRQHQTSYSSETRSRTRSSFTRSETASLTRSQPRSLLSMATLNKARSRKLPASSSHALIARTCLGSGGLF